MNHLTEEQLVLYYYGEDDGSPAVRGHLDECEQCRTAWASLQRVLNVVDALPVPERAAHYGTELWRRLEPKLSGRPRFVWPLFWPVRHWTATAAVAGLMLAAFLAGRYYPARTPGGRAGTQRASAPGTPRERILLVAVGDHLERSQTILVELVNARPGEPLDVTAERNRATDLLAENRLYRQTAAQAGDSRMASVLDELEPVLLEIAHAPEHLSPEALEQLRRRIEGDGILFKVRVAGSSVRHRERESVPGVRSKA
jgi:hypothetical protein